MSNQNLNAIPQTHCQNEHPLNEFSGNEMQNENKNKQKFGKANSNRNFKRKNAKRLDSFHAICSCSLSKKFDKRSVYVLKQATTASSYVE